MDQPFRSFLHALPDFPSDLPDFDPAKAPSDPGELFRLWLDEALAAGVPQPHAFSLATADGSGELSSRMLILKDISADGWEFATSRTSRKGHELSVNPRAAMNFYWPQLGRQVRVSGTVVLLSAEASARDWGERPGADGTSNDSWQLYALRPREMEFWQARADRHHIRHQLSFPAS